MKDESRFDTLGRLEDLPQDYRDDLTRQNLVPLWPNLRAVLPPGKPVPKTRATHWSYADAAAAAAQGRRAHADREGRAARAGARQSGPWPREHAGQRRDVPGNAAAAAGRVGAGAPPHAQRRAHDRRRRRRLDHGQRREVPDEPRRPDPHAHRPVARARPRRQRAGRLAGRARPAAGLLHGGVATTSTASARPSSRAAAIVAYARGGVVPTSVFQRTRRPYPMLRYPWVEARAALEALAADQPGVAAVQVTYVNPETGGDAQNILGYYALMLRPGQTLRPAGALAGGGVPPDRRRRRRARRGPARSRWPRPTPAARRVTPR